MTIREKLRLVIDTLTDDECAQVLAYLEVILAESTSADDPEAAR